MEYIFIIMKHIFISIMKCIIYIIKNFAGQLFSVFIVILTAHETGKAERKNDLRKCRPFFRVKLVSGENINILNGKNKPVPCKLIDEKRYKRSEICHAFYLKLHNIAPYSCYSLSIVIDVNNELLNENRKVICEVDGLSKDEEISIDYLDPLIRESKRRIYDKHFKNQLYWAPSDHERLDILNENFSLKGIEKTVNHEIKSIHDCGEKGIDNFIKFLVQEAETGSMYRINKVEVSIFSEQFEKLKYQYCPVKKIPVINENFKWINQKKTFKK